MLFQTPLISATLICRYKRFLADIILGDGRKATAHCPNPGSMQGLCNPGQHIWVEPNNDPRKKLKFSWRLVDHENGHFSGIDTHAANKIVKEALLKRKISGLDEYDICRPEVRYGAKSRIDFLLSQRGKKDIYIEVKSVTLMRTRGVAEFPDSVTERGLKHLHELAKVVEKGNRAILLFLVQRTDCNNFKIAADVDPAFAKAFYLACSIGVETLCLSCQLSPDMIGVDKEVPFEL